MLSTDIVVIGAGCIGLTAAIGLANKGMRIVVVDASIGEKTLTKPELRVSAISAASENIFRALNVWPAFEDARLAPYQLMKVWEKDSFGKIEFNAHTLGEPRLGHIIENDNIRNGLIKVAQQHQNIELKFNTKVQGLHNTDEQVLLTLDDGTPVVAKLCIAADGANSWVRKQLNIPVTFSDYDHHALVATVKTQEPHGDCARQVFLPQGPLALLPLADSHLCSIVWSSIPEKTNQLQHMSDADFNAAITAATDSELGVIEIQSNRPSYPLTMRYARSWYQQRVVFMGDAAHTIHPLAGLGMNLGLLDAASLIQLINKDELSSDQIAKSLFKYQGWRKAEAQTYIGAMGSLKELFAGKNPIKKIIRGLGLFVTDSAPIMKDKIIEHAMGISGNLPELAKPIDPI